jgi:hypothetical protein
VRGRDLNACKSEYLARFGLTARQFNAIRTDLGGRVQALRQSHRNRVEGLEQSVRATRRAIVDLERRERSLAKRPKRRRQRHDSGRAEKRRRVRFRLHQKKRRLAMLEGRLRVARAEKSALHSSPYSALLTASCSCGIGIHSRASNTST